MKSTELFKKVIAPVDCRYGAPMGRPSDDEKDKPKNQRIFDRKVPFVDYAYDQGGAYWGLPANLRVEYSQDLSYIRFYRN